MQAPQQDRVKAQASQQDCVKVQASQQGSNLVFTIGGVSFTMVHVQGGTFTMGATSEQGDDSYDDERPAHSVTLSPYYIGETEVTQGLWKAVMGSNLSRFSKGDNYPVERVSHDDCIEFCQKLSQKTGRAFTLPTEAQWEYAARGGHRRPSQTKYAGSNTLSDVAWYNDNSSRSTHPVKGKQPNALGLYDMSGNVWEWCLDWYGGYSSASQTNPSGPASGRSRVLRGGSCSSFARRCRVSYRGDIDPSYRSSGGGLRLVLLP